MLSERLQILVSSDQRRRLEHEARRRGTSVASVIRDAVDTQLGGVTREDRRAALDEILAMRGGRFAPPEELNRIAAGEHDDQAEQLARAVRR